MKKNFVKVVALMGILAMLLGLVSCRKSEKNENGDNEHHYFSSYTQEERKEYVADYLKENYGLTCEVSEVNQRQINAIWNEDYYFATARSQNDESISIWVDKYGEITDTVFMLDLQDQINECFVEKIDLQMDDYTIKSSTYFDSIPSKKWSSTDNMVDMLSDGRTFSSIWVFIDDDYPEENDRVLSQISSKIDFCNAYLFLYRCDDPQNIDIDTYDMDSYVASMKIERR